MLGWVILFYLFVVAPHAPPLVTVLLVMGAALADPKDWS